MRRPLRDLLPRWLAPSPTDERGEFLYRCAMARSRAAIFYAALGVPDSLDGRFDSLVLHVMLLVRRLGREPGTAPLAQAVCDAMFDDMDRTLREMGVGDLGVGRRVRQMGEALTGRIAAYDAALDADGDEAIAAALIRNLYGTCPGTDPGQVAAVASYLRTADSALAGQEAVRLVAEGPAFPALPAEG